MLRIVFFDWGNVLAPSVSKHLLRRARLPRTRATNALLRSACAGEIPAFEAVRRVVGGEGWRRLYEETISRRMTRPLRSAWRLARRLRASGVRTGILSNSAIEWAWNDLVSTPASREFDPVLFSALESLRIGRRLLKPDPAIFRHAIREAGTNPGETALLDDRLENVRAAAAAGLRAVHYVDARSAEAELRHLGARL